MSKISPDEKDAPKNDYKIGNKTFVKTTLSNLTVDFVSLNTTEPSNTLDSRPPITNPAWSRVTTHPFRNTTNKTSDYENEQFKSKFTIEDLYRGYNPMVGIKTGGTLGGCLFLVLLYLLYKGKCRQGSGSDTGSRRSSKATIGEEVKQPRVPQGSKSHETALLLEKPSVSAQNVPRTEPRLPKLEVNSIEATAEWVQTQPLDVRSLSDMSIVINIENASATDDEIEELEVAIPMVQENMLSILNRDTLPSPILETCSDIGSVENYPVQHLQMQRNSISNPVSIPTIPTPVTRPYLGHKPRASSLKRPSEHGHSQSLCSNISNQKSRSSNTLHVRFSSDTMINKPKRKYRSQTSLRSNSCSSGSSRSSHSSKRSDRSSRSDLSHRSDPSSKPLLKRIADKLVPSSGRWFRSCDHLSVDYGLQASSQTDPDEQTSMLKSRSMENTAL
jgi:hypothetical protein